VSFTNDQVGIERGATQLLLSREPRVLSRNAEGGVERAVAMGISGLAFVTEYAQSQTRRELRLALENLTAAKMSTLRTLLDAAGAVVVKTATGTATTQTCSFGAREDQVLEPIIGAYTDNAPAAITAWRAELLLYIEG